MNYQLIMLPNPILISDEEIKDGDFKYCSFDDITKIYKQSGQYYDTHEHKIIAGIPELPSIDFSALSEEDCKKIGWVDVEKLYSNSILTTKTLYHDSSLFEANKKGFIDGFKAAQSLNEKKYSEQDLRKAFEAGIHFNEESSEKFVIADNIKWRWENFIKFLSQPKIFDCLVETEEVEYGHVDDYSKPHGFKLQPKITNKSIKIIKVL